MSSRTRWRSPHRRMRCCSLRGSARPGETPCGGHSRPSSARRPCRRSGGNREAGAAPASARAAGRRACRAGERLRPRDPGGDRAVTTGHTARRRRDRRRSVRPGVHRAPARARRRRAHARRADGAVGAPDADRHVPALLLGGLLDLRSGAGARWTTTRPSTAVRLARPCRSPTTCATGAGTSVTPCRRGPAPRHARRAGGEGFCVHLADGERLRTAAS